MSVKIVIKPNTYFDSVSLMSISTRANKLDGVEQAFVAMATEMNKGVLKNLGLLTPELEQAKNGDLMIVINGKSGADNEQLLVEIEELFNSKAQSGSHEARYATIASAKKHIPESNLAVISVNGLFAAREARQALQNDLNVMLFSDNVSVEDELALKQLAHEKGLLMMGPDCGTAIINGAALCFGNAVHRGNIGIVGASGTGSQELSVRIHEFGGGVSQLIGTGGRDLSEKIGGLMMLDAIDMLEADEGTQVIALISKPPAPAVAEKVLARARACRQRAKGGVCCYPILCRLVGGCSVTLRPLHGSADRSGRQHRFSPFPWLCGPFRPTCPAGTGAGKRFHRACRRWSPAPAAPPRPLSFPALWRFSPGGCRPHREKER